MLVQSAFHMAFSKSNISLPASTKAMPHMQIPSVVILISSDRALIGLDVQELDSMILADPFQLRMFHDWLDLLLGIQSYCLS